MNYDLSIREKAINIFLLQGRISDFNLIDKLKTKLTSKINNSTMHYETNVKAKMSEFNSFNEDSDFHEFLNLITPYIKNINDKPFNIHSSWGNMYENQTDHTIMHNHQGCDFMSGILYLTDNGPGTYFKEFDFTTTEQIGKFLLFSPEADHEVKPFDYKDKRMIISFNLNSIRKWDLKNANR
jgi:hypothetical protein